MGALVNWGFYIRIICFRTVFAAPKSIQATVTILENLNVVLEKVSEEGFLEKEVITLLVNSFDSTTVQVQVGYRRGNLFFGCYNSFKFN